MENKINVIFEDSDSLVFTFEKNKNYTYYLMGQNDVFNYDTITSLKDNVFTMKKENYLKYNKFKVSGVVKYNNKEIMAYETETFSFEAKKLDNIDIKVIQSFDGVSLSFQTDEVYDNYIVYEKHGESYKIVLSTNDFMVTSNKISFGKTYYVEGYKKIDDKNILAAKSNVFECSPNREVLPLTDKIDLSIVIPIYNSKLFLPRCIDSILLSSYDNVNVVLIDDGSTDNCLDICNWYKDTYPSKFRVVHTENRGLSYARNTGLELVDGEYTQLMDSDDFIHPYTYQKSFEAVEKYKKPDMVIFKTIIKENGGKISTCIDFKKDNPDEYLYTYDDVFNNKTKNTNVYFCAVWDKMVKTNIVKMVKFPKSNYYEDSAYSPALFSYCDTFYYEPSAIYVWDKRNASTVGSYTTAYSKVDAVKLHDYFIQASIYQLSAGNKNRFKYLLYDALKEVVNSYKTINNGCYPILTKSYEVIMITIIQKFKALQNEYVINHKEMFDLLSRLVTN